MAHERTSTTGLPPWPVAPRANPPGSSGAPPRLRWVLRAAVPLSLITIAAMVALLSTDLDAHGRMTFFAFAVATVLWSATDLNAAFVGLGTSAFLVVSGAAPQEVLVGALASDVIWLLIGAFIIAAALRTSGLAERFARFCLGRARTVRGAFWLLTVALVPLAFVVPATSGRAAMLKPVFHSTAAAVRDRRALQALALLIPVIVLTSTAASLIAAASHLIVNDLLVQHGAPPFGFAQWMLYGAPFGIVSSLLACAVVLRWVVGRRRAALPFAFPRSRLRGFGRDETLVLTIVLAMVGLWLTQPWHGLTTATVAIVGALAMTFPGAGPLRWVEGVRSVNWNLLLFIGSALIIGRMLLQSGVAEWLVQGFLHLSPVGEGSSKPIVLLSLSLVALTAHLYIPSHATRAAVLMPPLLVMVKPLGLDMAAVAFITAMGMNYCLTFPVSARALQMYRELEPHGLEPGDLLRIGAVLLPLHLVLLVAFYFGYWRWVGLAL